MKNLLLTFVLMAAIAHLSFAQEKTYDEYSSSMDEMMESPKWENQAAQSNPTNTTEPNQKKSRNKWDFSDETDDKEKSAETKKKSSSKKQEYRRPKKWEPRKSVTTNNVTTSEIAK